jgi:hypothetical protein
MYKGWFNVHENEIAHVKHRQIIHEFIAINRGRLNRQDVTLDTSKQIAALRHIKVRSLAQTY